MKKKKRKIKASKMRMLILVPISCLAIGYFLYLLFSYPYNIVKLKQEHSIYEKELLKLEIDEKNLKNEIEKLKDPDYLARYARENYQYSKDGEIILKDINAGENIIKEIQSPNGYILSNEEMTFEIDKDGMEVAVCMENEKIEIPNTKNTTDNNLLMLMCLIVLIFVSRKKKKHEK